MKREFHKSPWFLLLIAFAIFGCGFIAADENRIEKEDAIRARIIKEIANRKIEQTDWIEVRHGQSR